MLCLSNWLNHCRHLAGTSFGGELSIVCFSRRFFVNNRRCPKVAASLARTSVRHYRQLRKLDLVGAIDQGTSSTRFMIFDLKNNHVVASHQKEIKQHFPHPGWVEIDPVEIISSVYECIDVAVQQLKEAGGSLQDVKAVGVANQRETTIAWDCDSGKPLHNAVVWLDSRTAELAEEASKRASSRTKDYFRRKTGLPISPYFSALKMHWLLQNIQPVKEAKERGTLKVGNVDAWIMWNLTGKHITDVTNASRTLLFDLNQLAWSPELCKFFNVPQEILPEVRSSAEPYGTVNSGLLKDISISGILGDQQASLVGHRCLSVGDIKNTYGTGTFMLCNVGKQPVFSRNGLLCTVAYQLGKNASVYYALEGSGSIGGNVIRFLRDNFSWFETVAECEALAKSVDSCEGVAFVPCFTGLYSPYWDASARGAILGLSQFSGKGHITRAALEAICYQTAEMLEAVVKDLPDGAKIQKFKADGGMMKNSFFSQLQSDKIGIDLIAAISPETTALGAAFAAAVGMNLVRTEDLASEGVCDSTVYSPRISKKERNDELKMWRDAVNRSRNWVVDRGTNL